MSVQHIHPSAMIVEEISLLGLKIANCLPENFTHFSFRYTRPSFSTHYEVEAASLL